MANHIISKTFHGCLDFVRIDETGLVRNTEAGNRLGTRVDGEVTYRFYPHFHPYVNELTQRLVREGISDFQQADTE